MKMLQMVMILLRGHGFACRNPYLLIRMKCFPCVLMIILAGAAACTSGCRQDKTTAVSIRATAPGAVKIDDAFWSPLLQVNREVSIPFVFDKIEQTGVLSNFARAAGLEEGTANGLWNADEYLYKNMEAAAYALMEAPDPRLEAYLDSLIGLLALAQDTDGYLNGYRQANRRAGVDRHPNFHNMDFGLELYLLGHMFEAAVAHHTATGKTNFLDIAERSAQLLCRTFGPDKRREVDGHQEVELALVRLYHATGKAEYLNLAAFFVEERGRAHGRKLVGEFAQDHMPITEQVEAVGQAPRATYYYSAVADVARLRGRDDYRKALDTLWHDVHGRKFYITGGIGSRHENEGFGPAYELPNLDAYTEICAAVSNSMWNYRMFLLEGHSRYFDIIERAMFNNFLAGVSRDGMGFFYACPPEADGRFAFNKGFTTDTPVNAWCDASHTRKPWFCCPCCPPNLTRYLYQYANMMYATAPGVVYANLFASGTASIDPGRGPVEIIQDTQYPWDGRVTWEMRPVESARFEFRVRMPGWATGNPVPTGLYSYTNPGPEEGVTIAVNGRQVEVRTERGYAVISRRWRRGDQVELRLPMAVRTVEADERVAENRAKVTLEYGPIVYCIEGIDHEGSVMDLLLPLSAGQELERVYRSDILGGTFVLEGRALRPGGAEVPLVALPYYLWSNRGPGEMRVWIPVR
jgi:uncharacterized protein